MKKKFLSAIAFFVINVVSSQEMPNITPPSPEASALSRFIEVPVSHYTGIPNISIPIYTISEKGIQIPISLSYHARGVQVADVAPSTGTGWSLIYGGSISRQIRGKADDTGFPYGYLENKNEFMNYASSLSARQAVEVREQVDTGYDFYPDQFSFNAGGTNGKFILNYMDEEPLLKTYDDVKISYQKGTGGQRNNKIVSFKIIDKNGNIYYYGISKDGFREGLDRQVSNGWTYFYTLIDQDSNQNGTETVYSSWKLMDIETAYGDVISYHYTQQSFVNYSKSYDNHLVPTGAVTNGVGGMNDINQIYTKLNKVTSYESHLDSITFKSGKVEFTQSSNFRDDYNGHSLDRITVYNYNNKQVKSYKLNYNYTTSSETSNVLPSIRSNSTIFAKSQKRLFLSSIEEEDDMGTKLPPYNFTYNSTVLPSRFSSSQDYWGYYNGADNGPFLRLFDYFPFTSDRRIHKDKSEAGLLKEIEYPTGGKTKFTYENNIGSSPGYGYSVLIPNINPNSENTIDSIYTKSDFDITQGRNWTKSITIPKGVEISLRVDCMHFRDPNDTVTPDCIFEFNANGTVLTPSNNYTFYSQHIGTPIVGQPNYVNLNINVNAPTFPGVFPDLYLNPAYDFFIRLKYTVNDELQSLYAGGKRIKSIETIDENGTTIKEFEYSGGQIVGLPSYINKDNSNGFEVLTHYFSSDSRYGSFQPNTIGYTNVIEYVGSKEENIGKTEYSFTNDPDSGGDYYNFPYHPSNDNEWIRGKNLKTKIFKNTNNNYELIKQIENTYDYGGDIMVSEFDNNYPEHLGFMDANFPSGADFFIDIPVDRRVERTISKLPFFMRDRRPLNAPANSAGRYRIYYVTGGVQNIKTTTETTYNNSGSLDTETTYLYDYDNHHQLAGSEILDSYGDVLKTENNYLIIDNANTFRILPTLIASYKGSTKLSEQNTIYSSLVPFLPEKIQTSKGTNSLEDRIVYHNYDSWGNPIEVSKKDGTHIVYIWGYNQTQPIAKIENATFSEVEAAVNGLSNSNYNSLLKIKTVSNNDNDRTIGALGNEGALRAALENLRASLPDAQVTTFTYDPLVGVTSITDPRGQTIYYDYDNFNRLKNVRDKDGNILTENEYHYKN
ncbi:RHS repeat domain-containing protein [Polaribacter porphyrae]|uniref:Sugar-binding protein n=1 Tax=Polaribacter porphyrae TaxID=1137780 RepID=A0A2S7WRS5_9FLAO|nr:RHS repeat domain-containing protein [Polaribacter porphyrae]PQJ80284.1 hypothetical protein BTO18_14335 [Polaribacter porphyrae]